MPLAPYRGPWTTAEAAHLLRRTTFGYSYAEMKVVARAGLAAALPTLLAPGPNELGPEPPRSTDLKTGAEPGKSWVELPYTKPSKRARQNSLRAWQSALLLDGRTGIREQMVLFWHDHFPVRSVNDPRIGYRYLQTLRSNALGNFRELTRRVTLDPAMLIFLNGNQNRGQSPNENYGRELLELFTIGKGKQVGPGDYSTYTEEDVREIARALTGWQVYGNKDGESGEFGSRFNPRRHDASIKRLSAYFDDATIVNGGDKEYETVIDLVLDRKEVAPFIVRKLYRWFVYYAIDEAVEAEVIAPLAKTFRDGHYAIAPVLSELLGSDHFFAVRQRGPMIKNPLAFTHGLIRQLALDPGALSDPKQREIAGNRLMQQANRMGMMHLDPPSVAGWKAYYQEPLFYRQWINASTLGDRNKLTDQLLTAGLPTGGRRIKPRLLALVQQFHDPTDLPALIEELVDFLLPRPLAPEQYAFLRGLVIPGLPDSQWLREYENYLAKPDDETIATALENKLRRTVKVILSMPEYQLS